MIANGMAAVGDWQRQDDIRQIHIRRPASSPVLLFDVEEEESLLLSCVEWCDGGWHRNTDAFSFSIWTVRLSMDLTKEPTCRIGKRLWNDPRNLFLLLVLVLDSFSFLLLLNDILSSTIQLMQCNSNFDYYDVVRFPIFLYITTYDERVTIILSDTSVIFMI